MVNVHPAKSTGRVEAALRECAMDRWFEPELPQIIAWYQPKIDLATGRVIGAEALARVKDSAYGVSSPASLLERATPAMLEALTVSVLSQALEAKREWSFEGHPLSMSVNVPACVIERPDTRERLLDIVRESSGDLGSVVFEIVETDEATDAEQFAVAIEDLRAAGIGVAIDDFGVGYSSLLRLMQCSFTELKIDRAFVKDAGRNPRVRAALDACVLLGKRLGLAITAEGVETAVDLVEAAAAGCDCVQGYLISRPIPRDAFMEFLCGNFHLKGVFD